MNKIVYFFFFLLFSQSYASFEFVDYKSEGCLSKEFMGELVSVFHPSIFFETGTYRGGTTLNAAGMFDQVITVEIHPQLFKRTSPKLKKRKNIRSYLANSAQLIEKIGGELKGTVLFWLDAHYSGEGTGMSSVQNSGSPEAITAIREELAAIHKVGITDCVVLIDDMRGFGTAIMDQIFLGCWAYPTVQELKSALLKINSNFEIVLVGDILLAYDQSKYNPVFSETVIACTKTRLYDGENLSNQELWSLEQKIKNAPRHEKAFIARLYQGMTGYADPMFWHDLWYGLTQMGDGNYANAVAAFQKVPERISSATFKFNATSPTTYKHPFLEIYLKDCR